MTAVSRSGADKAPLEDLMVAMDVVDTVRHRDLMVDRELDSDGRRQRLLTRLRQIYEAQGIEVSDAALAAGVDALEEDRFKYVPTADSFSASLARIYVRRSRWLKPVIGILTLGLIIWLVWYATVGLPESQLRAVLPNRIEATHARISTISASDKATQQANRLLSQAAEAIADDEHQDAVKIHEQMRSLLRELEVSYEVRIVSRPNEISGVWRVPDVNPDARNFYLIVEAMTSTGNVIPVRVKNEEDGRIEEKSKWGLRVSEETFEAVVADKGDDGIIQDDIVGAKTTGKLDPEYRVPTTGATITNW
ncbi:MAG: DUF6384 family protein [Woeseiaceae bacterium]